MAGSSSAREFARYLDAIVELTRQRDSHELLNSLNAALGKRIAARRICMLALSNPDHDTEFNESKDRKSVV